MTFSCDYNFEISSYSKLSFNFKNDLDYFFKNMEYSVKQKELTTIIRLNTLKVVINELFAKFTGAFIKFFFKGLAKPIWVIKSNGICDFCDG